MKPPKMIMIPDSKMVKDEFSSSKAKREVDPRPEFSITADALPAIKDWSVGKKYMVEMEVEMTGSRIEDYGDDKGKLKGQFKISGIMPEEAGEKEKEGMKKGGEVKKSSYPEGMKVKK